MIAKMSQFLTEINQKDDSRVGEQSLKVIFIKAIVQIIVTLSKHVSFCVVYIRFISEKSSLTAWSVILQCNFTICETNRTNKSKENSIEFNAVIN